MKKKTVQDYNKNTEASSIQNKNLKKPRLLLMIVIFISGIIFGLTMNYVLFCNHKSDRSMFAFKAKQNKLSIENSKQKDSAFEFINPYINSSTFNKIYHEELTSFKNLVEDYCVNAKKDKSIKQISFYFRDLTTGHWIGINEKEKFIPASLSKVPILIAAFQKAEKNPSYLKKTLTYEGSASASYLDAHPEIDDIRTSLKPSQSYTIEYLLDIMITKSDNEAAVLILKDIGIENLTILEKRLGYDIPKNATSATNIITVKNYSSFFRILYNASLLNREYSDKALEILSRTEYEKGIRLAIPSNIKISQKYGERDTLINPNKLQIQQLHNAGIVYYWGKPFFLCIMTKGSDKMKMEKTIFEISKITYQQVDKQVKLFPKLQLKEDIN